MTFLHFPPAHGNPFPISKQRKSNQGTPTNPKNQRNQNLYKIWKSGWDLAYIFGKRTTIHGMNRLFGEHEGRFERTVWFITIILAFFGSIYVCLLLSRRFNEGKFETVVDSTRLPVYKIPFPVITICNLNRLNWARIEEAKQRFLPNETSPVKLKLFERILGTYDDIRFANFDKFTVLENDPVELLNHVNFSTVVYFMTWRCEEILKSCEWRHTVMNCCEIFSIRRSKSGPCWSFNTLETDEGRRMKLLDPMWPWRTGGAGPASALKVRVLINPDKHYPNRINDKGLSVMVTEPYVWHKDPFTMAANTETFLGLEPVIYFYDNDTRSVSSDQRECVFEDEQTSSDFKSLMNYIYMIENCQSECHQEYLMRYCNCTVDLLFPPGQYPSCRAKDLMCLARNNDRFVYSHQPGEEEYVQTDYEGMSCKCFRNCYSLNYIGDVRSSFLPADVRDNVSYVDLDVHFRFETMMVYRTSLVFGWIDLMVAFGGIAGLFLGCSLISAIELGYFACIDVPKFVFERLNCRRREQTISQNEIRVHSTNHEIPQRYGGISRRNIANGKNKFDGFTIKNKMMKDSHVGNLQHGQIIAWQHHSEKNTIKDPHHGNYSYY